MIELDQIMRQQGDGELLNRVRIGSLTDEDHNILSERIVKKSGDNYPREQCIFGQKISLLMQITKKNAQY